MSLYSRSWPATRLQLIEPVICDPRYAGALWRDWGFARAACRAIRRAQPDLVVAQEPLPCCDVYDAHDGVHAVWLEQRRRCAAPADRFAAAVSPRGRYLVHAERRMFANPWLRAVICHSPMVRDEIAGRFGLPASRLHVIYNPVASERFHPGVAADRIPARERLGIDAGATVYVTIAGDFERAGVATAIDAHALLPARTHLIVIGDDPAVGRYRKRALARGTGGRVSFLPAARDARPSLAAADAFVLPALYDPSPEAVLQAMACALAVVATPQSGVAELVGRNDAGLLCQAGDVHGLAAHMATLRDPAAREHFGGNARRAVLPLSPDATTLELVLLYRDLLAAAAADA